MGGRYRGWGREEDDKIVLSIGRVDLWDSHSMTCICRYARRISSAYFVYLERYNNAINLTLTLRRFVNCCHNFDNKNEFCKRGRSYSIKPPGSSDGTYE